MEIKFEKGEKVIFVIYLVVFAYALAIQFTRIALPLATIMAPLAISLFVIFILHMINILLRIK